MLKIETVFDGDEVLRLDVFVSTLADVSRSRAASLIDDKNVIVNDKTASKN